MRKNMLLGIACALIAFISTASAVQRVVVVEEFTSTSWPSCPATAAALHQLLGEAGDSLAVVEYHPVSSDPYYTTEHAYRASIYGVSGTPTTVCDGILGKTGTTYSQFRADFNTRKVVAPQVTIDLSKSYYNPTARNGYVTAHITNVSGSSISGLLLIAVTETNLSGWYNVVRDLLRAAGSPVSLAPGASLDSTKYFVISSGGGWNPSNCEIVAFVQNNSTGEIYQAAKTPVLNIAVEENKKPIKPFEVTASPNPFTSGTTVNYAINEDGNKKVNIGIFDITGKLVKQLVNGSKAPGDYTAHWNGCDNLGKKVEAGVYFCVVSADSHKLVNKLVLTK